MEKDASTAGVNAVGGIVNTAEIKILICYILASLNEPVPGQMLANALHYEGIANYFEVNDAIFQLEKNGHIVSTDKDTYKITKKGIEIADTLRSSLPVVVRNRACTAAVKMLTHVKNAKDTDIRISRENGKTYINCSLLDNEIPFMGVKLMLADEMQAEAIKNKFLDDPTKVYSAIIDALTK